MDPRLNVLFVDDEQRILDGLRRQLHGRREAWEMRFAISGAEALQLLSQQPADIVVSDMRMPGMSGSQLFQRLLTEHPQTTRIILSGQTDQHDLMLDLSAIHQYLHKPCQPQQLIAAVERGFLLSKQLRQPELRLAATRITALPPGSKSYQALVAELSKEDASLQSAALLVAEDPALSVKLLQLVNSAFFGMPRRITSPRDAVILLGLQTLRAIVIAGRLFEFVASETQKSMTAASRKVRAGIESLWSSSFEIGERAGKLAARAGASEGQQHNARLAGLLCLLGRAILLTTGPAVYESVVASAVTAGSTLSQQESTYFKANQNDVTAYALGLWAFGDDLVAAVANQAEPSRMTPGDIHHPVGYLHLARCQVPVNFNGAADQMTLDPVFAALPEVAALLADTRTKAA